MWRRHAWTFASFNKINKVKGIDVAGLKHTKIGWEIQVSANIIAAIDSLAVSNAHFCVLRMSFFFLSQKKKNYCRFCRSKLMQDHFGTNDPQFNCNFYYRIFSSSTGWPTSIKNCNFTLYSNSELECVLIKSKDYCVCNFTCLNDILKVSWLWNACHSIFSMSYQEEGFVM